MTELEQLAKKVEDTYAAQTDAAAFLSAACTSTTEYDVALANALDELDEYLKEQDK